ncbi:HesB/IscA family protein [Thioalkalivibrio sp. HK1]|uniref:HesB/IscA family protein n=1 Tax=Thioalkalivibrio sp. HK1 TaxID=1469245 RepID=UPI00046F3DAD|nr:iron-sulfur cluster assembly accessory protein [Thioalkalivibrio sp. HK1]
MSITLSENAARRVHRFLADRSDAGLRLAVKRTGCSGFAYVVDLDDRIGEGDRVFESMGIKVIVDPQSLPMIDGTHIDFAQDGLNEGFTYDNPNVKNRCGCGESFGV